MRPTTTRTLNTKEFADIKHTVSIRSKARKNLLLDPSYAAPLPQEVSLQLTYRCNLRCTHCYQWNEQGFFRDFSIQKQKTELDLEVIEDNLFRGRQPDTQLQRVFGGQVAAQALAAANHTVPDRYQVRVLAFHRPLQGPLRVRVDREDTRVKSPRGNTCHQRVMGNGHVESCVAHGSLSVVVGARPLRAQGRGAILVGVCRVPSGFWGHGEAAHVVLGDRPRHQPRRLDVLNEGAQIPGARGAAFRRAGSLLDGGEVAVEETRAGQVVLVCDEARP